MPSLRLREAALMLPGRFAPFSLAGLFPAAHSAQSSVLNNVWLTVSCGERVALRGAAQSGRSSLLRLLAGQLTPTAGTCEVDGRVVAILDAGADLDPTATGRQNLERLAGDRADEAAELTCLGDLLDVPVGFASPGMRWRLGFAAAAVQPGEILLVDDCLREADLTYRPVALARLRRLVGAAPLAVVAEPELFAACSRTVELAGGQVSAPHRAAA